MTLGLADPFPIEPLRGPFQAQLTPPGSKSLTCRACILAALARGPSRLERPLRSDDTDRLRAALEALGARSRWEGEDLIFEGVDGRFPRGAALDLGDGGAPARFLMAAAAALAAEPVVIDGSPRLRQRPVAELAHLLQRMGARVRILGPHGGLPVRVEPGKDRPPGGELEVGTTASGQFVSALLLVAPWLERGLRLRFTGPVTSRGYVAMTAAVLRAWGVECALDRETAHVGPSAPRGCRFAVAPDASSATYWMNAAALHGGSRLRLPGLHRPGGQPDAEYGPLLARLGAVRCAVLEDALLIEGTGRGVAADGPIDMSEMPDAAPSLATLAALGREPISLEGLRTLRVKESDRIAALAVELERVGCAVHSGPEHLTVQPLAPAARGGPTVAIDTHRDHRMAMAFAIIGLARPGVLIRDPGCVAKSYPGFWADLETLRHHQGGA
jgi:3-phosphoshikimate 1-carboxyvinyltransferase